MTHQIKVSNELAEHLDLYTKNDDDAYQTIINYYNDLAGYASEGKLFELEKALDNGADLKFSNDNMFRKACSHNQLEVAQYLLFSNYRTIQADIHSNEDEAIRYSASNGHLDIVKFLYEHGADIHSRQDAAFRLAANYGHMNTVQYLISHDIKVNVCNYDAVNRALSEGHNEMVKYLINTDIEQQKKLSKKPLEKTKEIIIDLLHKIGYNYKAKISPYNHILKEALTYNNTEIIEFLLSKNTDYSVINEFGSEEQKSWFNSKNLKEKLFIELNKTPLEKTNHIKRNKI